MVSCIFLETVSCSTVPFLVMPFHAEATLTGIIVKELKWIAFLPKMNGVIPISIAVFPDDMWMPEEESTLFFINEIRSHTANLTILLY